MQPRAKSRSCDNYLSIKDAESLDSCIQNTLSALYRPFGVTAATVLWQLFSVVERQYRGDGLRCFIDFLLPAQRILQAVQQESCVKFRGLLFYHEGWPLCIHEKVVLQLAPLHKVRLKQGDFYFQIVPLGRKSAKLVIKCLSASGQALAEIPVPESMYGSVFTADFLQNAVAERRLHPLQNCLLTTGTAVYRTPWKNVAQPLFVGDAAMQPRCSRGAFRGHLSTSGSTGTLDSHRSSRESLLSQGADSTFSEPTSPHHDVDTTDASAPITELGPSGEAHSAADTVPAMLSLATDPSNPDPRRRIPRDSQGTFESRRLFRKSYMEALQNPMSLGSSSESMLEESSDHSPALRNGSPTPGSSPETRERVSRSRGRLGGDDSRPSTPLMYLQRRSAERRAERRSKSLERTRKVKGHRERSSSGGSVSISPKKLVNGYALRFGKLDVEAASPGVEKRGGKERPGHHEDHSESRRHRGEKSSSLAECLPKMTSEVNQELLASGAVILPGGRDRGGRAVLQVCSHAQVCAAESCTLTSLLGYYYSTLRKERRDRGVTVVIDSRKQPPAPALWSSLSELQTLVPNALYSVLILADKESAARTERDASLPTETLSSLKALLKHVDQSQLTPELDGTFHYDHSHWIHFRQKIEPFASSCSAAISSLQESITSLSSGAELRTAAEVSDVMTRQKKLMRCVLEDAGLNRLRLEGGTILARIRKEESCDNENYRDAVDLLSSLYNQVDEEVHKLVILSNKWQKRLESLLEVRRFEEQTQQIKVWFSVEGAKHLAPLEVLSLSVGKIAAMKERLELFLEESVRQQRHGLQLVKESPESVPPQVFLDFEQHLGSILSRAERRKIHLDTLGNLYEFYDSANHWMEHCLDYIRHLNLDAASSRLSLSVIPTLRDYCTEASKFSVDNFSPLNDMVLSLDSPQLLQRWNALWSECQQTKQQLEETLAQALAADSSKPVERHVMTPERHQQSGPLLLPDVSSCANGVVVAPTSEDDKPQSAGAFPESPCSSVSSLARFASDSTARRSPSVFDDTDSDCTLDSSVSEPVYSGASRIRKEPMKKIMKKTMSYELSPRDVGYTGVYIKGLEVTNNVSAEKKLQRPEVGRGRSMSTPSVSQGDLKKHSSKVQHIVDEMISTEREYVRSLGYITEHYFPEMERLDLPQGLRGKRGVIFGNVEKLWDFHCRYFLKELEACARSPWSVSSCFLRHEDHFGMYALYSKNKPQSDALLCSHGNEFFKNKQLELGDKMDLASYLLKPVQRMSKYALLLKDLIKECGQSREQELTDLRAAQEMVKFQLRHGNDLLAMDAVRGCDVNLKEQGQLRCQDEFIVWCGRRKYLRHVFLFEDLVLFSKTKRVEGGYDVYIYKQSFKTAEIGMTESVGDSGLRFEIWFRRRKSQDTFVLQAGSAEVKAAWTSVVGKILWRQALRNRELRMQEMVSMGIGSKPFVDIKPSEAAISDRAVDCFLKGSGSRSRASVAVSSYECASSIKRPHSTISNSSTSSSGSQSSSSLLGPLNLHLGSAQAHLHPSFAQWPYSCIEEDELEQDSGSQPSMMTESSETSSQCDSVSGLSTLTLPGLALDSFNDESFLCSSSAPASIFQKDQDHHPTKLITAL
ncbi:pleckstrin homology domain-containing family G member 4B isoform X2 [Synchiropus splendidus]|uniref:pleckstrin homology domain-containing family G member 4B isoform X2 n=1 Tax=Synchiropus splendidus TaxID=270530 RepID=UPI00237D6C36|nr:pleckstrin homology domain-containing family G member 4B isoform X2 [Synchiropus splendidus]